ITKAVEAALNHYGITVADRAALHKFIGPPLDESFPEFYGFDAARTAEATEVFRAYFDRQGWRENIPYPGVEDMLRDLRAAGKRLLVATSKPEVFALRIMEHFGLAQYFDHICGAPMDNQEGAKKAAVIRDALRRAGVEDLSTAVMVGDRRHDIDGARQAGLEAVGVLWGYGDLQELEASHPVHIVESFDGLKRVLI
ncbi:MAG TPA: HAD hydrolase-like protein, partial [Candidatus Pelethomonas intestinigallinarum]|nr:HAD hydrolase-like protein [Candidatus Pelethomonas intestinigallinarum]